MRTRDEVCVAAFCALSLFPCMGSSFKWTCWPQTKRKAAPTKGKPPLLSLMKATEWWKGHFEDSSLWTFVRLCAARSSVSSYGFKGETFLREIRWEVSKEPLFLSLKAPTNVSAHRLYLNPLWRVACQHRWVGRSIKRDPSIKPLPRATASVNSTRAHRLSRERVYARGAKFCTN